jgi:hypothetical protein
VDMPMQSVPNWLYISVGLSIINSNLIVNNAYLLSLEYFVPFALKVYSYRDDGICRLLPRIVQMDLYLTSR